MCRQGQHPSNKRHSDGKEATKKRIGTVTETSTSDSEGLYTISDKSLVKPFTVDVKLNGKPLSMELDTGATVSLISQNTFKRLFPGTELQQSSTKLHSYSGESISVLGQLQVDVSYDDQCVELPLLVVSGKGPNLFGRDWMLQIQLNWKNMYRVSSDTTLEQLLNHHKSLFEPGLGMLKDYRAKIYVDPQAKPKFCKARPVPYAM